MNALLLSLWIASIPPAGQSLDPPPDLNSSVRKISPKPSERAFELIAGATLGTGLVLAGASLPFSGWAIERYLSAQEVSPGTLVRTGREKEGASLVGTSFGLFLAGALVSSIGAYLVWLREDVLQEQRESHL